MTIDKGQVISHVRTILITLLVLHIPFGIAYGQTLQSTPSDLTSDVEHQPLKVLSYNIHMLPPLAKFTGKQRRAKRIGDLLKDSDFDVVIFQEAFHAGARRKIWERMRKTFLHSLGPANHRWYSLKTNSGIWIVSKIALTQLAELDFKYCEGPDCWARKGALLAEGTFNGQKFQVLGTHLEAGGEKEMKVTQYKELDSLLTYFRKGGVPQIVTGDFNTQKFKDTIWYNQLVSILGMEDGPILSEQKYSSDSYINDIKIHRGDSKKKGVIDYVFYVANGTEAEIRRYVRMPRSQWCRTRQDLSDHFAIEAHINFR